MEINFKINKNVINNLIRNIEKELNEKINMGVNYKLRKDSELFLKIILEKKIKQEKTFLILI